MLVEPRVGLRLRRERRRQDRDARELRHLPQHARLGQRQLAGVAQPAAAAQPADLLRHDGQRCCSRRGVDFPEHASRASTGTSRRRRSTASPPAFSATSAGTRSSTWPTWDRGRGTCSRRSNMNTVPYGARFDPANQDPTASGQSAAGQLLPAVPGLRRHQLLREHRHLRLQRAAGAGQPALRAAGCSSAWPTRLSQVARLHVGDRDRNGARQAADLQRRARLDLRAVVLRSDARRGHQLHLGPAQDRARYGTTR